MLEEMRNIRKSKGLTMKQLGDLVGVAEVDKFNYSINGYFEINVFPKRSYCQKSVFYPIITLLLYFLEKITTILERTKEIAF